MNWTHAIMTTGDAMRASGGEEPPEPPRLDHTVISALRGLGRPGTGGALPRLIPLFLATAAEQITTLRGALPAEDFATLHATAHTMKSGCASVGAARLAHLCETLETCCDARRGVRPDAAVIRDLVFRIEDEFAGAAETLRSVLARI